MQLDSRLFKKSRCEAREKSILRLRSGQARGMFTDTLERRYRAQRSRWAFFNSLLAILCFLGATSFAASSPFDDASVAYERGDYVQAMKLFRQLAEKTRRNRKSVSSAP